MHQGLEGYCATGAAGWNSLYWGMLVEKRTRVLLSTAHPMEIDLLRDGRRVPRREPLPPSPYFIFLSQYQKRPITDIWEVALDQPLPVVPIPLLPDDNEVPLDLEWHLPRSMMPLATI
jgi:hypothetical protein